MHRIFGATVNDATAVTIMLTTHPPIIPHIHYTIHPVLQCLSLKFFDGNVVSVPEFLDFFTSDAQARTARAATSAVRVSLDMLQLDVTTHYQVGAGTGAGACIHKLSCL